MSRCGKMEKLFQLQLQGDQDQSTPSFANARQMPSLKRVRTQRFRANICDASGVWALPHDRFTTSVRHREDSSAHLRSGGRPNNGIRRSCVGDKRGDGDI